MIKNSSCPEITHCPYCTCENEYWSFKKNQIIPLREATSEKICNFFNGIAALGALALTPVSGALADHPAGTGGKFTVHINRDISGFDHIKVPQGGMGRYQVLYAVHDKLFSKDANGKTVPRLATKATHSDDFKNWRVKSPKLDAAIKAIQAAGNDAELKKANCAFAKAKTEVVPYLPFEYAIAAIIHQKNIGGLTVPNDTVLGYHHIFRKK